MAFNGTWDITMKTPMGERKGKLSLAQDDTSLSGKMASPEGEIDIANGTVTGDRASWDVNATSPMPITLSFAAELDGAGLKGNVKFGAFGSGEFSGTPA